MIEIRQGTEVSNIDINMGTAVKVFALSGRLVDSETGKPVENLGIRLTIFSAGKRSGGLGSAVTSNNNGEFTVEGLPAGRYSIGVP